MMYPHAWRYRDWVIAAFNDDKPFDQFIKRAVRRRPPPGRPTANRPSTSIATGFLAIGSKTHNTQNRRQFVLDLADEQIDVDQPGVPRPDHRLCTVPRSQVRPDLPARLLRAVRHFPEHADLLRHAAGHGPEPQSVALDRAGRQSGQPSALPRLAPDRRTALEEQAGRAGRRPATRSPWTTTSARPR